MVKNISMNGKISLYVCRMIKRRQARTSDKCIKDKDENIKDRWWEYVDELFDRE